MVRQDECNAASCTHRAAYVVVRVKTSVMPRVCVILSGWCDEARDRRRVRCDCHVVMLADRGATVTSLMCVVGGARTASSLSRRLSAVRCHVVIPSAERGVTSLFRRCDFHIVTFLSVRGADGTS